MKVRNIFISLILLLPLYLQALIVDKISAQYMEKYHTITFFMKGNFKNISHGAFFIDSDNDPTTGYTNRRNHVFGADYLVEDYRLYRYPKGLKKGWKWQKIDGVEIFVNKRENVWSFDLPLDAIKYSEKINYTASVANKGFKKVIYHKDTHSIMLPSYLFDNLSADIGDKSQTLPIVIIGPSTVYMADEAESEVHEDKTECFLDGWGEHFYKYTDNLTPVYNYALPGAGAGSFRLSPAQSGEDERLYGPNRDHYWAKAKEKMQKFDSGILLIQFGGNDAWRLELKYPPKRDYDHDGDVDWDDNDVRWALKYKEFRNNVKFYIDEARSMHYLPVLITSPNGKKFENGHIVDTRDVDKYIKQMKDVGASENVMVLDLHKKSMEEYEKYGKTETDRIFDVCYFRKGNRDYNHFSPQGANIVARWVRDLACEDPNSELCRVLK